MAKRIPIMRVEPIELEFEDGSTKKLILNNNALMILNQEFGEIEKVFEKANEQPIDVMSKLIYVGIKSTEPNFTFQEAEVITVNGGLALLEELTEHLVQVLDVYIKDEGAKKKIFQDIENQIQELKV